LSRHGRTWIAALLAIPILLAGTAARAQTTTVDPEAVAKAVEEYLAKRQELTASKEPSRWESALTKLSLYGDLRLRHESQVKRDDQDDRHRERLRLRLGANYQVHPELQVGTRIVTGDPDDPNSPHVTLGSGFDKLQMHFDRIFAKYTPECWKGSYATAGKFAHPFTTNPIYGELVWDQDIQPEGIAGGFGEKLDGTISRYDVVVGQYLLIEQNNAHDTSMSVAQASANIDLGEETTSTAAIGYYYYGATSPDGAAELVGDNQGNQVTAGAYDSDFGIVNPILTVTQPISEVPVTLIGEFIANVRTGDRKFGWALGAAAGTAAKPGDWRGYYQWQVVEQESIFSAFSNDDFLLATNHRSHVFGAKYRVVDKVVFHAWALASRPDHRGTTVTTDSLTDQWNLRFDIDISF